jgi:hypothetical protein
MGETAAEVISEIRERYAGEIIYGKDLEVIR